MKLTEEADLWNLCYTKHPYRTHGNTFGKKSWQNKYIAEIGNLITIILAILQKINSSKMDDKNM